MAIPSRIRVSVIGASEINARRLQKYLSRAAGVVKLIKVESVSIIPHPENGSEYGPGELIKHIGEERGVDYEVILTAHKLKGNFFGWFYDKSKEILVTTYELDYICEIVNIELEIGISYVIVEGVVTRHFIEMGGDPERLFVDPPEGAPFDFCGNKMDARFLIENPTLTNRVKHELQSVGISNEIISSIDRSFRNLRPSKIDKVRRILSEKLADILIGVVLGSFFTFLGMSFG